MSEQKRRERREVTLAGDLTLPRAGEIREQLLSALEGEEVVLRFGGTGAVDLSFVQLLCAARRSASVRERRLTVAGDPVPRAVASLVRRAGLAPRDAAADPFWWALAGSPGEGGGDG